MRRRDTAAVLVLLLAVAGLVRSAQAAPSAKPRASTATIARPTPPVPELPSTTVTKTIKSGGRIRTYNVYRPARTTLAAVPLVIAIHGLNMTAEQMQQVTHFDVEAERQGFIVIFPQGYGKSWNVDAVGCCGEAARLRIDDGSFLNDVITKATKDYLVDPKRIFVTGFSNGAFMSYDMACRYPTRIAAIGPVSGYDFNRCSPKTPVSVIHLHGLADQIAPYQSWGRAGVEHWRVNDVCPRSSLAYKAPVHSDVARGCRGRSAVELYTIDGMKHMWPSMFDPLSPVGVDATSMIWTFFAAHGR